VRRLAASDLDGEARRLFIRWCDAAGCIVRVNRIGNIFARRPGRDPSLPAVMTRQRSRHPADRRQVRRSLWVITGLEVVRTLNELGYETEAAIDIFAWTNEEGARFSPAIVGSGVFAGVFDLGQGLARPDKLTGVTLGAEFEPIGFAGAEPVGGTPVAAYFEAHIEQGPILEAAAKPIGVVTGAAGPALVRGHRHRSGGACRADPDAASARRRQGHSAFLRQIGLGTEFITRLCTRRLR
jgi:beta-ureidopropionase / N-carbamoyl-L-amino-acid hydrolase